MCSLAQSACYLLACVSAQSTSLTNNQILPTLLAGQNLTIFTGNRVTVSGVQTAANVTQANIVADKVGMFSLCLAHDDVFHNGIFPVQS